jgi:hypothetical protein
LQLNAEDINNLMYQMTDAEQVDGFWAHYITIRDYNPF